jgi:hypothetical protein
MRRTLVIAALVLAGAGVGAGTVLASGALGDDEPVEVITVPAEPASAPAEPGAESSRFVVEDGISRADAERLSAGALKAVPGTPISVERDDGLYQVEIRDRGGRILEVLIDDRFAVVGTDGDED